MAMGELGDAIEALLHACVPPAALAAAPQLQGLASNLREQMARAAATLSAEQPPSKGCCTVC